MADLEPVEGNPFAAVAPPPDGKLTPVAGDPFAASGEAPLGAASLTPVQGDPFVQDKPEAGLTPVTGNPFSPTGTASPPPLAASDEDPLDPQTPHHNPIIRGAVTGFLKNNPEMGGYALEALSHDAPEFMKGSLLSGSKSLKDLAMLSPEEYNTKSGSFFTSLQAGISPTLDFLGEGLGGALASTAPSIAAGLVGAGVGGGLGTLAAPGPGTFVGATGGAIAGAGSMSFALNLGEVYKALLDEKIDPLTASRYAKAAAVPMAALDVASVGPIIARLGGLSEVKKEVARAIARRVAVEGAKGGGREGITEAAQEAVKVATVSVAADKPFWSIDNVDAIVGSGVVGFAAGGTLGSASGIKRDVLPQRPPGPADIKAAHEALSGTPAGATPMPGSTETVQSMAQDPSWYYSEVRKVAEEKLPKVGSAEQILATLSNSPGVKQEEIAALGIPEFLAEAKGPISKADLIAHIEDRAVRVDTVDTVEAPPMKATWATSVNTKGNREWAIEEAPGWKIEARERPSVLGASRTEFFIHGPSGTERNFGHSTIEAAQGSLARAIRGPGLTEYGRWTLPGGENYREVKLTLPRATEDKYGITDPETTYQSPHFSENNIVAHFRAKDRTDAEGKRGLGIEEIQSDWHQEGRKKGYGGSKFQWEDAGTVQDEFFSEQEAREAAIAAGRPNARVFPMEGQIAIPNAPFKTTWSELALKRILRMAADEGQERVYIMPGREQARRYGQTGKEEAGQIEFYDNILPRLMEKWARKLGGKTGTTEIQLPEENDAIRGFTPARRIAVRYLELSPEMQTRIARGVPLFSALNGEVLPAGQVTVREDASTHRVGSLEPTAVAMRAAATQAAIPIGQIAKKMGIDVPISLYLTAGTNYLGQLHTRRNADGELTTFQIDLNVPAHKTAPEMYATIAHEFGHAVHRYFFGKASNLTKMRIHLAFTKYKDAIKGETSLQKILKVRDNFIVDAYNTRQFTGKNIDILNMTPEHRNYWLSFDEWMAEQVAKWMTTGEKPLSIVDKYFSALGRKMRELYQFFRTRFGDIGEPTAQVSDWLNTLLTETDVMSYETIKALENRTTQINKSAMAKDGAPYFPAEPMSGSTILLHDLVSSLGVGLQSASALAGIDRFSKFYEYGLTMLQVAARNPHIAGLQRYRELWQNKQLERTQIMDGALTTLKAWRKVPSGQQDAIAGLLDDYGRMEFLTPVEKTLGISRLPSPVELNKMVNDNKVSTQGLNVFKQVIKDFNDMLTRYGDLLVSKANEITDPIAQAVALQAIGVQIAELRKRPYVPSMRFGDLTLTIKDAAGSVIHFETFETERKRKGAVRDLTPKLKAGETISIGVLAKDAAPMMGLPPGLLDLMAQKLSLSPTQQGALEQLRFELAPAQSFKHRFQRKNRVEGYSTDFMRAYANYFFHGSNYFTNVKYIDPLRAEIKNVKDSARLMYDGTKRGQIANFMSDHLAYMMDPKGDFAALRSLAFLWYLGYAPVAAFINLSQMLVGSGPLLSSKFGDTKTIAAMLKAGGNLSTYYRKASLAASSDREVRAISEGHKEGIITEAMAPEIAAISEGRNLQKGFGGNLLQKGWQRFMEHASWMFEMTEQMNRRITFRAAFKLATENPAAPYVAESVSKHKLLFDRLKASNWTDQDAAAFVVAKDAVEATQYVYAPYAQPRFMRGHLRTVFVFKSFIQNTLFMLWNYPTAAIRSILVMGFLAGFMGLPGAEDLKGILKAIAWQLFGKEFDIEDEARKLVIEVTGGSMSPDLILHGMSRYGFNIPAIMSHLGAGNNDTRRNPDGTLKNLEFDLSSSMGMGQISPVDIGHMFGPTSTKDPSRAIADASQRASGAVYGVGFNMYRTMQDLAMKEPFWKSMERSLPREAASISRMYRAFAEGREKDKKGNTVVNYDVSDPRQMAEAIGMGLGFHTLRSTAEWDRKTAEIEGKTVWDIRRQIILNQLWAARGDPDNYEQVTGAMQKFNEDARNTAGAQMQVITADTIKRSFETRMKSQNAVEGGMPRIKKDIPLAREIQKLYPDAEIDVRTSK